MRGGGGGGGGRECGGGGKDPVRGKRYGWFREQGLKVRI